MSSDDQVRIDALINLLTLDRIERQKEAARQAEILTRIERIERAHAIPMVYSLREACQRLGFKESWGRKHIAELPKPAKNKPLRFNVSDIEAFAIHGVPLKGRKAPRARERRAS